MDNLGSFTDEELLVLLSENNHSAYTEIYNRYSGILYLHAYNKLRDREEAKDILQELFITIWNKRKELAINISLPAYLYSAIRNRVFKKMASNTLKTRYAESIQESIKNHECITDHLTRQNQLAALIESEIHSLPPKMREVFLLSRKSHLSHKEIAHHLQISETTVKKQVNNALKVLRAKLGNFVWLLFLIKF